jgi:phosphatidylserine/phosphatidylglycerophosphate/cardiolipin synthase-like enzyme
LNRLIINSAHYSDVLSKVKDVKSTLWIGTADIKDLYVEMGKQKIPFLSLLARLIKKGVSVRLIHAKEPGPAFREDFDKYPELFDGLERVLCPRVHFKMIILDCKTAYIGSANLTGAGMGMKSENNRNFEAGILTDDPPIVEQAMDQFDSVWNGSMCKKCRRKQYCADPISNI